MIRSEPSKQAALKHPYRGAFPDYSLGFEGVRSQVPVAQYGRTGWELLILEQGAGLQALLLQGFIVLLQILDGIPVGSEPIRGRSFLAQPRCRPGHPAHPPGVRQGSVVASWARGGEFGQAAGWGGAEGCPKHSNSPGGRRHQKCKYVPEVYPRRGQGAGSGRSRRTWDCGRCLVLLPPYLLFCCPFLKYAFNEERGKPVFLQTCLFTDVKRLCAFSVLKVRLENQCFKNSDEDGLKLLSFLLRSGSILLEGCVATKPGAAHLLLQLTWLWGCH